MSYINFRPGKLSCKIMNVVTGRAGNGHCYNFASQSIEYTFINTKIILIDLKIFDRLQCGDFKYIHRQSQNKLRF